MGRQQYEQFCLRFSPDNPQHVKVLRILNNLDRDLYKSKTQFIMEASRIDELYPFFVSIFIWKGDFRL